MQTKTLKLIAITLCALSATASQAASPYYQYLSFTEMPTKTSGMHQCMSHGDNAEANGKKKMVSAWCDQAQSYSFDYASGRSLPRTLYIKPKDDNAQCVTAGSDNTVNLERCGELNTQKWIFYKIGNGLTFRSYNDNTLCLDIRGGSSASIGSDIILWACGPDSDPKPNQFLRFLARPV